MSGYDHDAEAEAEADRESSAASSLVFTSDEEGDPRVGVDSSAQLYEGPSQASARDAASSSASSISARSSPSASPSQRSRGSPPRQQQTHDRHRRSSSSSTASSSSSSSSERHTSKTQHTRAADTPAFPDLAPSLSALLPQGLFESAAASSSFSSAIALPPGRAAQALHYFEAALRSGQKRSRDQAESVLRRQKRRADQAAAAAEGKGARGRGRRKGTKGKQGLGDAEDARRLTEAYDEAEMQRRDAEGEARKPKVEISWIEEEAKLWIRALDADRPRQRSNSQSGSAPRLYSALSSSQRQSQSGGMGSQQQQQQRAPPVASRSAEAVSIRQGSQGRGRQEVAAQGQPSSASQGRHFAGFRKMGR